MKNAGIWIALALFAGAAVGFLINDYVCKMQMDKQNIKKTFGVFQG